MKLVEYKCPSCGASLKVEKNAKSFVCSYCGASSKIDDNLIKVQLVEDGEDDFELIKTLIDDNRYDPAIDRLFKLSLKVPVDPKVWKYMIIVMTNKMDELNPEIPLEKYCIGTKSEHITLEHAIELYKKYETDKEEKEEFLNECYELLERYNYRKYKLNEQRQKEEGLSGEKDLLYAEVINYAINMSEISASLIQRKFSIGYNRAARIIDRLQEEGIVGPYRRNRSCEVLVRINDEDDD